MMSGAECSTGASPLSSLLKQQNQDHSLHQSGYNQQIGPSGTSSLRTNLNGNGQNVDAERFFQQQQQNGVMNTMNLDGLRRELQGVDRSGMSSDKSKFARLRQKQKANASIVRLGVTISTSTSSTS